MDLWDGSRKMCRQSTAWQILLYGVIRANGNSKDCTVVMKKTLMIGKNFGIFDITIFSDWMARSNEYNLNDTALLHKRIFAAFD